MRERYKKVEPFAMPTEYERAAMEARRRQRMAEMLAQQEFKPSDYPTAPIPSAYPLARVLKGFLSGREEALAEKELKKAEAADVEGYLKLREELGPRSQIAAPTKTQIAESVGMPQIAEDGTVSYGQTTMPKLGMESVMPTAEERERTLETALFTGSPTARKYAELMMARKPDEIEYLAPTIVGEDREFVRFPKTGKGEPIRTGLTAPPEYRAEPFSQATVMRNGRPVVINARTGEEIGEAPPPQPTLAVVQGPGGPVYTTTVGAVGQTPGATAKPPKMSGGERLRVVDEIGKRDAFAEGATRTQYFKSLIANKKLPLSIASSLQYELERSIDPEGTSAPPGEKPAYVNYYSMLRFVDEQVNTILQNAKGTQTEGDALRARQQILDNPNNEAVVLSALDDLERTFKKAQERSQTQIDYLEEPYRQDQSEGNW